MQFQVIDTGAAFVVAYPNHRGEFIAVLECGTREAAQTEAQRLTNERAQARANAFDHSNRYLRRFN